MKTSIIILTYNKLEYTKQCIESIRKFTQKGTYEIIVVDNHSEDDSVKWLRQQEDLKCIFNDENMGFPKGCNQGIEMATGDNIMLLNNDVIVTHNWLAQLKECLYSSDSIGAVGPVTNSCSNFQAIPVPYITIEGIHDFAKTYNMTTPSKWEERLRLIAFCLLIKKEIIQQVGLLDELFSPGNYEDDDYCLRMRQAGFRIMLCKDTFIHHFGSVSFGQNTHAVGSVLFRNRQAFIKKWNVDPFMFMDLREDIITIIKNEKAKDPNILHIDCEAGGTLLGIKHQRPDANLYGITACRNAVVNTEHFAKMDVGDFHEILQNYPDHFFDHIIFTIYGKEITYYIETLKQLKKYLKINGHFIATFPKNFNMQSEQNKDKIRMIFPSFSYSLNNTLNHTLLHLKNEEAFNQKEIAFICCVNDEDVYSKSLNFIKTNLHIPDGYEVEIISKKDSISMTKAYNEAMTSSNAKYKVYMHQDVFITHPHFIEDVIRIFQQYPRIGMLGVAGAKTLPPSGIWWDSSDTYGKVYDSHTGKMELLQFNEVNNDFETVKAIDGLIMITQYDIPWRDDIFDGWHYYDTSQSFEFHKAGLEVAIPKQEKPWCIHDCGIVNLHNGYEDYRQRFIKEYLSIKEPIQNVNPNKICFISCINDHNLHHKLLSYIAQLEIPYGYQLDFKFIKDAHSITSAYNTAMEESDAKYKIYLHQDVFITHKNFLKDIIDLFEQDKKIGMIGVVGGTTIPSNGMWWQSADVYGTIYDSHTGQMELYEFKKVDHTHHHQKVLAVAGIIMITQYDVPWREDIFDGWHFYEMSQCSEFTKAGYDIIVPQQEEPWCIHDCGIGHMDNEFEMYRKIYVKEYLNN